MHDLPITLRLLPESVFPEGHFPELQADRESRRAGQRELSAQLPVKTMKQGHAQGAAAGGSKACGQSYPVVSNGKLVGIISRS